MDLQFPHHENEKAQSEAAHDKTFARYWMHNGFIRVDDEKMSKSLNNFFTLREVLEHYSGEEVRFFIANSHYRSPLNYSQSQLDASRAALRRLYTALRNCATVPEAGTDQAAIDRFNEAMNDDLNTPEAFAVLFDLAGDINREAANDSDRTNVLANTLRLLGSRLGLLQGDPETVLKAQTGSEGELSSEAIDALIAERISARESKDWARSDEIRDTLAEQGIILEDSGGKTTWRRG